MQTQKEYDDTIKSRNSMMEAIRGTIQKLDSDEIEDSEQDENHHQALSIDTTTTKTILLTCGGPSIGIDLVFNDIGEVLRGSYWSTAHTGGNTVTVELHDDDLEEIMRVYNIEY